jgi:hypothetical protein
MHQNPSPRSTPHRTANAGSVAVNSYVLSFDSERFYRGWRYHWMICTTRNPDELLSWGHAPTRELAEMAAGNAITNLKSGLIQGRRSTSRSKSPIRRYRL